MDFLEKIIKVTQAQYDTLASGGTVGEYTGLSPSYLYLILNDNEVTNIINGQGSGSVQMVQDGDSGTFDFTGKNPNATALDSSLTGQIAYGATGAFSTVLGSKAQASGKRSFAHGTTTVAKGAYSHAEGDNSVALGADSHAEGYATTANGNASHSEGNSTVSNATGSHVEGAFSKINANANYSHAEGHLTEILHEIPQESRGGGGTSNPPDPSGGSTDPNDYLGWYSHVEGEQNKTLGYSSHAEGVLTKSYGNYSHAEGWGTQAGDIDRTNNKMLGDASHAEGKDTKATGKYSHAEGFETVASGENSHAEGVQTKASGYNSFATGQNSEAKANTSFVAGYGTVADTNAYCSAVFGYGGISTHPYQFLTGLFPQEQNNTYFAVGNGTGTLASPSRKNAFEVRGDGSVLTGGTLTVGQNKQYAGSGYAFRVLKSGDGSNLFSIKGDGTTHLQDCEITSIAQLTNNDYDVVYYKPKGGKGINYYPITTEGVKSTIMSRDTNGYSKVVAPTTYVNDSYDACLINKHWAIEYAKTLIKKKYKHFVIITGTATDGSQEDYQIEVCFEVTNSNATPITTTALLAAQCGNENFALSGYVRSNQAQGGTTYLYYPPTRLEVGTSITDSMIYCIGFRDYQVALSEITNLTITDSVTE